MLRYEDEMLQRGRSLFDGDNRGDDRGCSVSAEDVKDVSTDNCAGRSSGLFNDDTTHLSLDQIQAEVKAHFHSTETYVKEMSETRAVFRKLSHLKAPSSSSSNISTSRVLSLACGSAVGAEIFTDFFTHPEARFIGMDVELTQTVTFLKKHGYIHNFVLEDLYAEPASDAAIQEFTTCTHWMAIHACRLLANRIVELFHKYALSGAHLVIVPCCLSKNSVLQQSVGYMRWKEIRDKRQARDTTTGRPTQSNWRMQMAVQARNEILANEYSNAFRSASAIPEIQSLHNVALHYENSRTDDDVNGGDVHDIEPSRDVDRKVQIQSIFDGICIECS